MRLSLFLLLLNLTGCAGFGNLPQTLAEKQTSFSYIPFDPLPVQTFTGASCDVSEDEKKLRNIDTVYVRSLRESFPDQTVRLAVAEFDADGTLSFGPTTVGYKGSSYQVIIDYMNTDTVKGSFLVKRTIAGQVPTRKWWGGTYAYRDYNKGDTIGLFDEVPDSVITVYDVLPNPEDTQFQNVYSDLTEVKDRVDASKKLKNEGYEIINLPVYVGVGLRMTATVTVNKGEVNLSGLPEIAAEAKAGKLSGTLVVQTLGATGELVSSHLPLPSELNRTTIQNAILAIGSIKTLLTDEKVRLTPRVVGIYNPIGGGQSFTNGIISSLAAERISWHQPCDYKQKEP